MRRRRRFFNSPLQLCFDFEARLPAPTVTGLTWQEEHARLACIVVYASDPQRRREARTQMVALRMAYGGAPINLVAATTAWTSYSPNETPRPRQRGTRLDPNAQEKVCHRCSKRKDIDEFRRRTGPRDGRDTLCDGCRRQSNAAAKLKYRAKFRMSARAEFGQAVAC